METALAERIEVVGGGELLADVVERAVLIQESSRGDRAHPTDPGHTVRAIADESDIVAPA